MRRQGWHTSEARTRHAGSVGSTRRRISPMRSSTSSGGTLRPRARSPTLLPVGCCGGGAMSPERPFWSDDTRGGSGARGARTRSQLPSQ
ncbi:hypothetical protein HU200_062794 [Digitaria exilis]|uniref:Uncharacterized protein n=1 Tax=Digitaria exilis TaxID=1010633 RepID=A0A835A8E1_9POAL|nr:hypothetical protein HU200_062794 [Digitaria exilis]